MKKNREIVDNYMVLSSIKQLNTIIQELKEKDLKENLRPILRGLGFNQEVTELIIENDINLDWYEIEQQVNRLDFVNVILAIQIFLSNFLKEQRKKAIPEQEYKKQFNIIQEQTNDNFNQLTNTIEENSNNISKKTLELNIKELYLKHKINFEKDLISKKNVGYAKSIINQLRKLFSYDLDTIIEIQNIIWDVTKVPGRTNNSFRVFLTYLQTNGGIDPDVVDKLRTYIKGGVDSGVDDRVPSISDLIKSISIIRNELSIEDLMFYFALLESGARYEELVKVISEYDKSKHFIVDDEISYYKLFWIRAKKKSYYLFFRTSTLNFINNNLEKYKDGRLNYYKKRLSSKESVQSVKYCRKFTFNQMISSGISVDIADYYEGRLNNVGARHYLGKEDTLIEQWKKYLPVIKKLEEVK